MRCSECRKRADIVYENKKYCQSCFFTVDFKQLGGTLGEEKPIYKEKKKIANYKAF